jgi:hypothetical protein
VEAMCETKASHLLQRNDNDNRFTWFSTVIFSESGHLLFLQRRKSFSSSLLKLLCVSLSLCNKEICCLQCISNSSIYRHSSSRRRPGPSARNVADCATLQIAFKYQSDLIKFMRWSSLVNKHWSLRKRALFQVHSIIQFKH